MLQQEYPTQIQPRSSSTRETPDAFVELQNSSNKVDAEASRILINLANQDTSSLQHFMGSSNNLMMIDNKFKRRVSGDIKVSLPIKTDANLHLQQERSQPDPIMLLAAAAAVIDDEGKYKGRSYERREIRLHGRHASAKRKSFTYGSNDDSDGRSSSSILHRRHSERRHRYHHQRPSVSMQTDSNDTWPGLTSSSFVNNNHISAAGTEEDVKGNESQSEGTRAFSWQYLSMQNPRIKRNAMHAYITYMIYTDMAHEQQQQRQQQQQQQQSVYNNNSNNRYTPIKEEQKEVVYPSNGMQAQQSDWYSSTKQQNSMQSYRLPPSPRQRHDPPLPPTESIIGQPLTDFLFERNNGSNNNVLPPPPPTTTTTTSTSGSRLPNNFF